MAINMLVTRARMSALFALVETHNYLIYISFPPQNRKPLFAPALRFPPPPPATITLIVQSVSEALSGKGETTAETGGEKAHGSGDAQPGSASRGDSLGRKPTDCSDLSVVHFCFIIDSFFFNSNPMNVVCLNQSAFSRF